MIQLRHLDIGNITWPTKCTQPFVDTTETIHDPCFWMGNQSKTAHALNEAATDAKIGATRMQCDCAFQTEPNLIVKMNSAVIHSTRRLLNQGSNTLYLTQNDV